MLRQLRALLHERDARAYIAVPKQRLPDTFDTRTVFFRNLLYCPLPCDSHFGQSAVVQQTRRMR